MTSAEESDLSGFDQSREYRIHRDPDITTITQRAEIRYRCQWIGKGHQPTVARGDYSEPRDGVHWYKYSAKPPRHFWQNQLKSMDVGFTWQHTWEEDPGFYSVIAIIRSESEPNALPTRSAVTQQIGETGTILRESLESLLAKGDTPTLPAVKAQTDKYLKTLTEIEKRFPITDARKKDRHDRTVAHWRAYADALAVLLEKTENKRRIPLRGLHLETATQRKHPLFLFLVDMGEVQTIQAGGLLASEKKWLLVDWTNAETPRFRGEFEGQGLTDEQAIASALSNWDWSNRYPAGHVTYELPVEIHRLVGGPARRQMDTNGKSLTEEVIEVLGWIAVGAMMVSGVCALFMSVPALGSEIFAAALFSSTGGAVLSIAERRRQGIFDWRADVIDGLTVVSNFIGAGAWARGARVAALDRFGKTIDYVFLGARVGTDGVQGLLIAEGHFETLNAIAEDSDLSPEERARESLKVIGDLAALGVMTYFSFKATAKELDHLETKAVHVVNEQVAAPDQVKSPKERIETLVDKKGNLDLTTPPVAEGHTSKPQTTGDQNAKPGRHRTTVVVAEAHTPPPTILKPEETNLAKAFPDEGTLRERRLSKTDIIFYDRDGYYFSATCDDGTLDINIDLANPKKDPPRSQVLRAKELYPLMYDHFEQQGNRVERLSATWAKDNFKDAKPVYDQMIHEKKSPDEAAREAVQHARTYKKYHLPQGLTKIVNPEYHGTSFTAEFQRADKAKGKS